jgi:hypothetical protein
VKKAGGLKKFFSKKKKTLFAVKSALDVIRGYDREKGIFTMNSVPLPTSL